MAPTFSYGPDRTTAGIKYQVFDAGFRLVRISAAAEGLYSSKEELGGRVFVGAKVGELLYLYAAPGNFWDSGVYLRGTGRFGVYATFGVWDRTAGLSWQARNTTQVHSGYSRAYGWVLGLTQVIGISQ